MTTIKTFLKAHPVLTYFAFVFAISWGSFLALIGPAAFIGARQISFAELGTSTVLAFLAGPIMAGTLTTGLVHGKAGLRDLGARLRRWRVGILWYAVAFLTAPLLTTGALLVLSRVSPAFLPELVTSTNASSLLLTGIISALVVPFFEELGWTGFAVPELRKRHGVLITGLIVGVIWGVWHLPLFLGIVRSSAVVPPVVFLAVLLFSWLVAYRVLMVWVYDRTQSLFLTIAMHAMIVFGSLVLIPQSLSAERVATFDLLFAALLWLAVAAAAIGNGGDLSRQSIDAATTKGEVLRGKTKNLFP